MIALAKAATGRRKSDRRPSYYAEAEAVASHREPDMVPTIVSAPGTYSQRRKKEPIGQRIIELPKEIRRSRATRRALVAYVPKGSIAKGEELAMTGGDHVGSSTISSREDREQHVHVRQIAQLNAKPYLAGDRLLSSHTQLYDFKHGAPVRKSRS